jgi:periplasmic protein TonB
LIAPDGRVRNLRVLSGHPLLTQAALEAVRHWRYQPTLLNGDPMEVDTTVQVIFKLQ